MNEVLAAFRTALAVPAGPEGTSASARGRPRRAFVQALAWGLFAVATGALSVWPRYELLEPGQAVVSLSFSHAGQRIGECRTLTQEELEKLPPTMRKPTDCPRERLPVYVEFSVDGDPRYRESLQPSGVWNDGESTVYRRIRVATGDRSLHIGMRDSAREAGFDYEHARLVALADGQHLVVEFDHVNQVFVFR